MALMMFLLVLTSAIMYALPSTLLKQYQRDTRLHEEYPETLIESGSICTEDLMKKRVYCYNKNLRVVPDNLPPDIQMLDLQNNRIHTLLNSSFARYTKLVILDLSYNDIRHIEPTTFATLIHLQSLDLGFNKGLQLVNPRGTQWSQSITLLLLSSCEIKLLPADILQWFPRLKDVVLINNIMSHIDLACSPLREELIEKISLSGNTIHELTPETLKLDCDIYHLDLFRNHLIRIIPDAISSLRVQSLSLGMFHPAQGLWKDLFTGIAKSRIKRLSIQNAPLDITPDLFDPMDNYPLVKLHLSNNNLKQINHLAFSNLTQVKHLVIEYNEISIIEPEHFGGMRHLQILQLSRNQIKKINPFNTTWNTDILELYLHDNSLRNIHEDAFRGLHNLTVLDLAYNKGLSILTISPVTGLHNLQVLNVTGAKLQKLSLNVPLLRSIVLYNSANMVGTCWLPGETFHHTPSLEEIYLNNSHMLIGRIWDKRSNKSLFDGLSNLKIISLRRNMIVSLVPGMFMELHALKQLDLSFCHISEIDSNVFHGLTSLEILSLEQNEIEQLPAHLLSDLERLQSYSIKGNKVYYLDSEVFANNPILKELNLSKNQFATFNQSTFGPLKSTLTSIDISENPLVCKCEMAWLLEWLKGSSQLKVIEKNKSVCSMSSAESLQGKPLLTFDPQVFCGPNIGLFCSIPLAVVGLFAMIIFVHRYRWLVRYKLFLLKLAIVGYEEVLDARDHGDFEFDLNVMFLENDEEWVQEHLRPILEERLPNFNRNAFGDEDLTLGMHYFDAVYHVIEKSFKTVLLLSRAAFQDNWFMIKFRIAFEQVNDARMENVVLIFLEDIQDAELPFLVRLYLSDRRTYLWWTEDVRGQEYFWNELILTLQRDNMRWNNLIPPE